MINHPGAHATKPSSRAWPLKLLAFAPLATAAAALLSGCGGGSSVADDTISQDTEQGYAADAAALPVAAANGLDSASAELQTALSATAGGNAETQRMHAQAAGPVGVTANCALGGTMTWTISGGNLAQEMNGQFDAGEVYTVSYTACAVAEGSLVIDGSLTLTVAAHDAGVSDLGLQATALRLTTGQGSFVLDGGARLQRSSAPGTSGGTLVNSQITSSGLTLLTSIDTSYTLGALDWNVQRSYDASGVLAARSHQGSLNLASHNTRRPALTMQVASQGALTLASDGWLAQGSLTVVAAGNKLGVSAASGMVTITLDLGSDGTVDRSWSLTRGGFQSAAG